MVCTLQVTSTATVVPEQPAVAPRFVSQLKGTNVILEGQRAHFECRIEPQNDPNMRVQWLLNGSEVKASSRIQTNNDFGYVAIDILDASKEDAGTYICTASNGVGSMSADQIELRVLCKYDS